MLQSCVLKYNSSIPDHILYHVIGLLNPFVMKAQKLAFLSSLSFIGFCVFGVLGATHSFGILRSNKIGC